MRATREGEGAGFKGTGAAGEVVLLADTFKNYYEPDNLRAAMRVLEAAGYHQSKTWPYAYGCFKNGRPVPNRARHLYRRLGGEAERFGDPLDTASSDSFFRWSRRQMGALGTMKRCWWSVHRVLREVRRAFAPRDG